MIRWQIALLVAMAIAISYLDRQALPVAIKAIAVDIPVTNEQFSQLQSAFLLAYAVMYAGGGKLMDVLGTRRGFTVIMLFWSLACASHGLAASVGALAFSRALLGAGEGGGFPAATRVVAEWFPVQERSTAMGIINAGTAVGMVVAPPLIALVLGTSDWRWVFYLTGALGLAWTLWWHRAYFPPDRHPRLGEAERQEIQSALAQALRTGGGLAVAAAAALPRDLGRRDRQVPERCRVVLLPVLAAQVSLRCSRLRHQGGGSLRLDPAARGGHRLPVRGLALQPAAPAPGSPWTARARSPWA